MTQYLTIGGTCRVLTCGIPNFVRFRRTRVFELQSILTEIMPCQPKTEKCNYSPNHEDNCVLSTGNKVSMVQVHGKSHRPYLRRSIQPITSRLRPRVFAASSIRFCVPFNIPRWSIKLLRTSCPCARKLSSWVSVSCRNVCSLRAWSCREVGGGTILNGDSDTGGDWA